MPVIVRDLDDDAAVIIMVDSNLQRENILPSERAKAYQMKYEAIRHQGQRSDLTFGQVVQKSNLSVVLDDSSHPASSYMQKPFHLDGSLTFEDWIPP